MTDYIRKSNLWSEVQMGPSVTAAEIVAILGSNGDFPQVMSISYDTTSGDWEVGVCWYNGAPTEPHTGNGPQYLRATRNPDNTPIVGYLYTLDVALADDTNFNVA
jgi:hypothetical protein